MNKYHMLLQKRWMYILSFKAHCIIHNDCLCCMPFAHAVYKYPTSKEQLHRRASGTNTIMLIHGGPNSGN